MPINFCNRSRDLSSRLPQAPLVSDSKVGVDSFISRRPFPEEQRCHDEDGGTGLGRVAALGQATPKFSSVKPSAVGQSCWAGWGSRPRLLPAPRSPQHPSRHCAFVRSRKRCHDLSLALSLCIPSDSSVCVWGRGSWLWSCVCAIPRQVRAEEPRGGVSPRSA